MRYLACLVLLGCLGFWTYSFHGGAPPGFNDPAIPGPCFTWEHEDNRGAELLHFPPLDYYDGPGEWVPYATVNGLAPATDPCTGFFWSNGSYDAAGRIGWPTRMSLWSNPKTALPPGTRGFYCWSTDYVPVRYTPLGWSALKPPVYFTEFTPDNSYRLYHNGLWIGWSATIPIPSDPALIGTRLFYQGAMLDPTDSIEHPLGGTWMLTFHDEP